MTKQLILPRRDKEGNHYLSYSQISTWKRSKRDYIRQYFYGEGFKGNPYTDFGSKVGEALENNDFSGFDEEDAEFLATVPRYDQFEREIKLKMDGFYVKGFIDTNTKDCIKLADYKTGDILKKTPEYESDDYNQVEIYSAAIEQEEGVLPECGQVFLIGRKGNSFKGEELRLTREFATIDKEVNPERIKQVLAEVQKVAEEISSYYQTFLKLIGDE